MSDLGPITTELASLVLPPPPGAATPLTRRQAVVTAIGTPAGSVSINLGGTVIPGVKYLGGYAPAVGDVVWVVVDGGDLIVLGALSVDHVADVLRANFNLSGGRLIFNPVTGKLRWTFRLIVMGNGGGSHFSTSGYFDVSMPAAGTVTPVYPGAATVTWDAAGIALSPWDALYYELPLGSNFPSVPANFRVVRYSSGDFVVPPNWIFIGVRNADMTPDTVRLGNGMYALDDWHEIGATGEPAFQNGWVNYDPTGFATAAFRKNPHDNTVQLKGLVKNGTLAAAMFTLPAGHSPTLGAIMATATNTGFGEYRIAASGASFLQTGGTAYCSLDNLSCVAS